ncbi:MAG: zinc ribbon domain-containing protein, partial [Nitrososphaerota archaeon]
IIDICFINLTVVQQIPYIFTTYRTCGHINEPSNSREFRCSICGAEYNRDVNAAANIAGKALTMIAENTYTSKYQFLLMPNP